MVAWTSMMGDMGLDRVQQGFEEQDLETPRVSLVQSGVGMAAPFLEVDFLSEGELAS